MHGWLLVGVVLATVGVGYLKASAGLKFVGIVLVAFPGLVLMHEVAHALAGRLVGFRIGEIKVGSGPEVWRGRIGRLRLAVGRYWLFAEGHCIPSKAPRRPARWRYVVFTGAPLLVHAVLIPVSITGHWPALITFWNVILFVRTVRPFESDAHMSDGLKLWRFFKDPDLLRKHEAITPVFAAWRAKDYERAWSAGTRAVESCPDEPAWKEWLIDIAILAGRRDDALAACDELEPGGAGVSPEEAALGAVSPANGIRFKRARIFFEFGEPQRAEKQYLAGIADASFEEEKTHLDALRAFAATIAGRPEDPVDAYAKLPWVPGVLLAKVLYLIESGRNADALACIAIDETAAPEHDFAGERTALKAVAKNDPRLLSRARRLDTTRFLLDYAEARLKAASSEPSSS